MNWRNKPLLRLIAIVVVGISADVGTKLWAQSALVNERFQQRSIDYPVCGNNKQELLRSAFLLANATPVTVIPNIFRFRYVENCGSSFNMMNNVPESFRFPFLVGVALFACFIIPFLYLKTSADRLYTLYALPFIFSGALGNLIDRIVYRHVVDFVDWYVVFGGHEYHWPTFNIADALIMVGIGLMLLQVKKDMTLMETTAPFASEAATRNSEENAAEPLVKAEKKQWKK